MITYLYSNNYKSLVNFRINFNQMNLLLGYNGTGKSSILILLAILSNFIRGNGQVANLFSASTLTRWTESSIQTYELGLSTGDGSYVYHLEIEYDQDAFFGRVLKEEVLYEGQKVLSCVDGHAMIFDDNGKGKEALTDQSMSSVSIAPTSQNHMHLQNFKNAFFKVLICSPDPRQMRDIVENDIYAPSLDFSNIGSVYAGIGQLNPDIHVELRNAMKGINGSFVRSRIQLEAFSKHLVLDYCYDGVEKPYHLSELSDGEKMLFALYMILYGYMKKGYVVLLDEPDNFISLREIQPWCIQVENELGEDGQCIMISHNAEMIDYLAGHSGLWLSRNSSGESTIIPDPYLDDKQMFTYSELMARGEEDAIK